MINSIGTHHSRGLKYYPRVSFYISHNRNRHKTVHHRRYRYSGSYRYGWLSVRVFLVAGTGGLTLFVLALKGLLTGRAPVKLSHFRMETRGADHVAGGLQYFKPYIKLWDWLAVMKKQPPSWPSSSRLRITLASRS